MPESFINSTLGLGRSIKNKRRTQRQPLACKACTKSKVRCDKNVPCARCFRRNTPCEREAVEISVGQRRKSTCTTSSQSESNAVGVQTISSGIQSGLPCVSKRHELQRIDPGNTSQLLDKLERNQPKAQVKFEDLATCIEGLAWGRHQCHKYPHSSCLRFEPQHASSAPTLISELVHRRLPDTQSARRLVDFHIRMLSWNHNVLHGPTFLHQCEKFWTSKTVPDNQWLALYCAVLSTSAWSVYNDPRCQDKVGLLHTKQTPAELFELVSDILNSEGFMDRHTIFTLQAICISGMVANVLGKSNLLVTWINAAIRIAQCLGLHHIGPDTSELRNEALQKEVGRRVWWKLVELDYHSIPYTGTYSINAKHCTTQLPRNSNDEDLHHQSQEVLTSSTYALIKARMAMLIPTLLDGPDHGTDVASRYEHVISIDRKMRQLVTGIPSAILRAQSNPQAGFEWLPLARRTLAIAAADKIIMIHRSFLLKSFQSPAYLFTRQTCVSAAMTILREHEELAVAGQECPPIWVHSAFCVTAVVVICLELLYCHASMAQQRKDQYVHLIRGARARLIASKYDTMARRGVYLVDAMLNDELYATATQDSSEDATRHKFVQILQRFIQLDQNEPPSMPALEFNDSVIGEQFEDFDIWFSSHFR